MTDTKRIRKLAEWMGWTWDDAGEPVYWADEKGNMIASPGWNPLTRIQDAWMLVENTSENFFIYRTEANTWCATFDEFLAPEWSEADTASEAIVKAIEKLIESKP